MALTKDTKTNEEKEDVKKKGIKYSMDTLISAATNRPVKEGEGKIKPHIYWCEACKVKLTHPMSAIAHFSSKYHFQSADAYLKGDTGKRKLANATSTKSEPPAKANKRTPDSTARGASKKGGPNNNKNMGKPGFNEFAALIAGTLSGGNFPNMGNFNNPGAGNFNNSGGNYNNFGSNGFGNYNEGMNNWNNSGGNFNDSGMGNYNNAGGGNFNNPGGNYNNTGGIGNFFDNRGPDNFNNAGSNVNQMGSNFNSFGGGNYDNRGNANVNSGGNFSNRSGGNFNNAGGNNFANRGDGNFSNSGGPNFNNSGNNASIIKRDGFNLSREPKFTGPQNMNNRAFQNVGNNFAMGNRGGNQSQRGASNSHGGFSGGGNPNLNSPPYGRQGNMGRR